LIDRRHQPHQQKQQNDNYLKVTGKARSPTN